MNSKSWGEREKQRKSKTALKETLTDTEQLVRKDRSKLKQKGTNKQTQLEKEGKYQTNRQTDRIETPEQTDYRHKGQTDGQSGIKRENMIKISNRQFTDSITD